MRKHSLLIAIGTLTLISAVHAQVKASPVSYNLKASIEPGQGAIAVQGEIIVPISDPGAKTLSFGLHETFAVKKLTVKGHAVKVS